jgi:hypothetical protein
MATIHLPDDLSNLLRERARRRRKSLEAYVIDTLRETTQPADSLPDSERATAELLELVERIRTRPSSSTAITPPRRSLAEALAVQPEDPAFDLDEWEQEWSRVEREIKRIELEDALADLRKEP